MIYQTLLRHRKLPVTPMIPRFSRVSIPSQAVMPFNLTLKILSVGPHHLGSYLISPKVNTSVSPAKKSPVQPTYIIKETPLESCDTEKGLRVWVSMSSNLTSYKQVTEQCAKANKLLGFVRRASRYIQSIQTRRTLYLSIVRCHFRYAT